MRGLHNRNAVAVRRRGDPGSGRFERGVRDIHRRGSGKQAVAPERGDRTAEVPERWPGVFAEGVGDGTGMMRVLILKRVSLFFPHSLSFTHSLSLSLSTK